MAPDGTGSTILHGLMGAVASRWYIAQGAADVVARPVPVPVLCRRFLSKRVRSMVVMFKRKVKGTGVKGMGSTLERGSEKGTPHKLVRTLAIPFA